MRLRAVNYDDLVSVVKKIGGIEAVAYKELSPSNFRIWIFFAGGNAFAQWPYSSQQPKPGAFDTDFPDAIELTAELLPDHGGG